MYLPDDVAHVAGAFARCDRRPVPGIDYDVPGLVALTVPPSFIYIDVLVAGGFQTGGSHGARLANHNRRVNCI